MLVRVSVVLDRRAANSALINGLALALTAERYIGTMEDSVAKRRPWRKERCTGDDERARHAIRGRADALESALKQFCLDRVLAMVVVTVQAPIAH